MTKKSKIINKIKNILLTKNITIIYHLNMGDKYSNVVLKGLWIDEESDEVKGEIDWSGHTTEEPIDVLPARVLLDILKFILSHEE